MHALKRRMLALGSDQSSDHRELIHSLRQQRHMFADFDAFHVRVNRGKLSAIFNRSQRLEVEHVLMRRPAWQEDHDDRLMIRPFSGRRFRLQQLRKTKSSHPQRADLNSSSSTNAVTQFQCRPLNRQHLAFSPRMFAATFTPAFCASQTDNSSPIRVPQGKGGRGSALGFAAEQRGNDGLWF